MSRASNTGDCYVIGIDFGTTYSGVAWCWSKQPETIKIVPTEISYDIHSHDHPVSWGYDVEVDPEPVRWFKLLLVPEQDITEEMERSEHIRRARRLAAHYNKHPVQIVADYLQLLWKHALQDIRDSRGSVAVNGLPFKVWITIPAIWNNSMQKNMRKAAELAGISEPRIAGPTTIGLVAEPEAAALAVLAEVKDGPGIEPGDVFVVCDAGGGTVDLISYEVVRTTPMQVRECVQGVGKMCGAIFVDEAFEDMLRSTLGEKWNRISAENRKKILHIWNVTVPTEAFSGSFFKRTSFQNDRGRPPIVKGQIPFSRGHVRLFFERVLGDIKGLIHQQVNAVKSKKNGIPPKMIMLVGGFGSSGYLYRQIQNDFEQQRRIQVLQPSEPGPWTAVCRGAVLRGLSDIPMRLDDSIDSRLAGLFLAASQSATSTSTLSTNDFSEISRLGSPSILSRISRENYGISHFAAFIEGKHDERDRHWCTQELEFLAKNQMDWYVKQGDDMYDKRPVRIDYYRRFESAAAMREGIGMNVYVNTEAKRPTRITNRVEHLDRFVITIDDPFESFEEYTSRSGKVLRHVPYTLEMVSTGVTMEFSMYIRGRVHGKHDVRLKSARPP